MDEEIATFEEESEVPAAGKFSTMGVIHLPAFGIVAAVMGWLMR